MFCPPKINNIHLRSLAQQTLILLQQLFAVRETSPQKGWVRLRSAEVFKEGSEPQRAGWREVGQEEPERDEVARDGDGVGLVFFANISPNIFKRASLPAPVRPFLHTKSNTTSIRSCLPSLPIIYRAPSIVYSG
jgi:hypothetical protein